MKYWVVINKNAGEGVLFDDEDDANYAHTGVSSSFGVSTLADNFREQLEGHEDLEMKEINI